MIYSVKKNVTVFASGAVERTRNVLSHQRHGSVQGTKGTHVHTGGIQASAVRPTRRGQ